MCLASRGKPAWNDRDPRAVAAGVNAMLSLVVVLSVSRHKGSNPPRGSSNRQS
jgi:hypothetical protein